MGYLVKELMLFFLKRTIKIGVISPYTKFFSVNLIKNPQIHSQYALQAKIFYKKN